MRDEYLWDRSGEPDPEIQQLEEVLGRLRSQQSAPHWSEKSRVRTMPEPGRWGGAIAAGVVLVIAASWLVSRPFQTAWKVARVAGTPTVGSHMIYATGQLTVGQALVTDSNSRAKLGVWNIGEVELAPNSRLRLLRADKTDQRLALDRGTLHASIWAPPRLFSVETPAAVAVDLGCEYTLHVDSSGATTLHVIMGWVGFNQNGHESWVPAGAECVMRRGTQPGTPYFVDASGAFRTALDRFDFEHDPSALDGILPAARPRDALTLWHLLPKLHGAAQALVYERMAALAPPPAGVTRQGILADDRQMFDRWWDELNFGDSSLWRIWKGPSPFQTK
jgi:ferric-dicitrate binding protein FerR (iron transport regulator)